MRDFLRLLKPGYALGVQLTRANALPLLCLLVVTSTINIASENYLAGLDKSADTERLLTQVGVGLWGLFEGILLILVLAHGIPFVRNLRSPHLQPNPFRGDYLLSFLAEYLRGLAQVLLWSLLLLVPGFVRYVRLLFLPYVVLFSRNYREGKADAIALSYQLTIGRLATMMGLTVIPALIEAGLVFLPQLVDDLHVWPVRVVIDAIGYGISVWVFAMLYLLFEEALAAREEVPA